MRPTLARSATRMAASLALPAFLAICGTASVAPLALAQPGQIDREHSESTQPTGIYALGENPFAELYDAFGADVARYHQHVLTLSNPYFEGRAPGTEGNTLAQNYIEFWFRQFGLQPAFPSTSIASDGSELVKPFQSYRQIFETGLEMQIDEAALSWLAGDAGAQSLVNGVDFAVLGMSGSGEFTAPLVFTGYSVVAGPEEYGTYFGPNADLTGKVAVVLRFEPIDENGKSKWAREGAGWSSYAGLAPKITAAVRRGATGVIVINPPGADDPRVNTLATWRETIGQGGSSTVPVVMLSQEAGDALIRRADAQGRSLADLRKLADEAGSVIDLPNAKVTFGVKTRFGPIPTANVGAILPGRGALKDEYIVIGSHFDHVGYGWFGSRSGESGVIHPGADDNASGTSGMLLLAERLSRAYASPDAPADLRSVFFMGYSAEESGLFGSKYYVDNMIAPKEKHAIMLNLDMIGRIREGRLEANGTGTASGLEEMVKPFFDASGLAIAARPGGTGPSDHASFYAAGIPVMFFFSGLHDEYHTPADIASLINPVGAVKAVDMVEKIAMASATKPTAFEFQSTGGGQAMGGQRRVRVRFGVAPGDYSGSVPGVLIGSVFPETSAAEAGLQAGDLMTKWGETELKTVEDWMPMLEKAAPGDVVEVTYIRDGKTQTTKVTLKGRSTGG